ncbi:tRNA (carboxymethyluridine(34)-5-O)-methyltransferase ALKBH8 isoform X2 [Ranitomeya variabilis]|uniref:tRNA (carboxymethyluridine(34)-5-O)-methyltransferase ALKBH8 isoform X2 n=1 Tax=Ranitomeya variabilis TaxID=490064 RepID=UPI0040562339
MAAPRETVAEQILERSTRPKLSKEQKRLQKKEAKAKNILLRHEGIESASHPTKSLVVANGGLGNGVSRERLLDVLKVYGMVESLVMPPNKPYCFVTYSSPEAAISAYSSLSGRDILFVDTEQKITLYLSFVDKVEVKETSPPALPPGLLIVEDFVSLEEELILLENIHWETENDHQKSLKHRRVKHYGYEFRYDNNNVDKNQPLPEGLPALCKILMGRCLHQGLIKNMPDQLTINQYEPGQGIPPHIDTHSAFEDEITSLSLGSEIVMDFRHPDGTSVPVMVPQRSLLVMSGESRSLWTHGITPRKFDVVQISEGQKVETVSRNAGELTLSRRAYPLVCDSQQGLEKKSPPRVSDLVPESLEKEYVHKVYEDIAGHFSSTRHSPWPKVVDFLRSLSAGSLVADVGCGNGKYIGVNKNLYMIGCDRSKNLVDICGERQFEACVCDALSVPFRSGSFDACISIAVIHHFATEERRLAAIQELISLLKAGGKALIYVWAMEQEYKKNKSKYLKEGKTSNEAIPKNAKCDQARQESGAALPIHTNRTAFNSQDLLVPWHLKGNNQSRNNEATSAKEENQLVPGSVYHRYYHVFREGELEALCTRVTGVAVRHSYHDQGNWCVIIEKL